MGGDIFTKETVNVICPDVYRLNRLRGNPGRVAPYDQVVLWAHLQAGIIDVHRGDIAEAIVVNPELNPHSCTPEAAQVELVVRPGLGVAALPEQCIDPVTIPV